MQAEVVLYVAPRSVQHSELVVLATFVCVLNVLISQRKQHNVQLLNPAVVTFNLANISSRLHRDCCERQEYFLERSNGRWQVSFTFAIE